MSNRKPAFIVPHAHITEHYYYDEKAVEVRPDGQKIFGCIRYKKNGKIKKGWISPEGYAHMKIRYKGKTYSYRYHRLIWFIVCEHWPSEDQDVDHINEIKTDNRLKANLRLVTVPEHKKLHAKRGTLEFA